MNRALQYLEVIEQYSYQLDGDMEHGVWAHVFNVRLELWAILYWTEMGLFEQTSVLKKVHRAFTYLTSVHDRVCTRHEEEQAEQAEQADEQKTFGALHCAAECLVKLEAFDALRCAAECLVKLEALCLASLPLEALFSTPAIAVC